MRRIIQVGLIVAGLIHFLPVTGATGGDQLRAAMYAIPFADPNLMRHRAVMLGLLDGLVLEAAFRPAMEGIGILVGTVDLASIVGLAWSTGSYDQALSRVVVAEQHCLTLLAGGSCSGGDRTSRKVRPLSCLDLSLSSRWPWRSRLQA